MDELQRWVDSAPTIRRYSVEYTGPGRNPYLVTVWTDGDVHAEFVGKGATLNFAAVRAIMAWAVEYLTDE